MIVLPPDTMSPEHIKLLRDNGICVVVAKNPMSVRFVDPIPCQSSRTQIEDAAIKLSRKALNGQIYNGDGTKVFAEHYVKLLISGTPLDERGTQEDQEKRTFQLAKDDEIRRLAREEAKAERAALKKTPTA